LGLNIKLLCEIASVSKSGYYRWLIRSREPEKDHDDYILIEEIFKNGKAKFGWRTIQMELNRRGISMNHKKIKRIKKKYGMITKIRRINPYKMVMKKTQEHRTFDNILNREFNQPFPQKMFCTDITYLPFNRRLAYLSVVKDIASGEIMAWHLSPNITMDVVLRTIDDLKQNRSIKNLENVVIHSDQGFHYTNPEYISRIKNLNMVQSMSRKGNCIDNAPMESFFGHFKDDVEYKSCKTFEELKLLTQKYMHYYNYERPQWNLKKMTPVTYRNHLLRSSA